MTKRNLTFDRGSVRSYDDAGRLHVSDTPISKACVSPYYGWEIPGSEALGLDPDRIYNMLRPAEELAKAASTFDGLPLLLLHAPTSADNHPHEQVVGSVGTGVTFDGVYLRGPLSVWTDQAIAGIESGELRELSSSYSYTADMTSGEFDGESYDGKMLNINGNHVAIVPRGRVGPDVLVSDSAITTTTTPPEGTQKMATLAEFLVELGLTEENIAQALDLAAPAAADAEDPEDKPEDPEPAEPKKAEDAAIQIKLATDALRAEFRALEQAKQAVRGTVGDVVGMDSAPDVYRFALKQLGVDFNGMPPEGLALLYKVAASARQTVQPTIRVASDAETVKQFPGLSRFDKGF